MWKQKIGISVNNSYSIPTVDVVRIIKSVEFDAISPVWQANSNLSETVNTARQNKGGHDL